MFAVNSRVILARGEPSHDNGCTGTVLEYREEPDGFPWYVVLMDHDWMPWHIAERRLDALPDVSTAGH